MEALTFLASDKETVIDLQIAKSTKINPTEGYFFPAENKILLGSERWAEWQDISGNSDKQKKFVEKLIKLHRREINPH